MNIIPVIRDLLLRNQKAVIPGVGAFVLAQRPAQLNKVTRVLTPPGVTVKFDRHQHSDDGALTGYLTGKLKVDKDLALKAIEEFKASIAEKLGNNEPVVLEGLGTLTKKPSGEATFIPEEDLLKRLSLFEMPKIEVPQKPAEKVIPSPTPVITPVATIEKKIPINTEISYPSRRRWILPVILIVLLVGMLGVIYFTGNMNMLVSDIKSVLGIAKKDTSEQLVFGRDTSEQEGSDTLNSRISRELDEQVDRGKALAYDKSVNEPVEQNNIEMDIAESKPENDVVYAKAYHIIAGSFTVLVNAEKQRSSLHAKGLKAEILPKKGNFYMVSLGSFDTSGEAVAERQQLQAKAGIDLWVMKNK